MRKQIKQPDERRTFLIQAQIEIEKVRGYYEDLDCRLQRAFAIQWIFDQNGDDRELGIRKAIKEMIDDLSYYLERLNDKGGEGYEDLIRSAFFGQVETEFTKEAVNRSLEKQGISK